MMRKIPALAFWGAALLAPALTPALTPAWAAPDDISRPAVAKSVRHAFGGLRHDYFVPGRVGDQVVMGLGIPDPAKPAGDGNYLLSGCRPHSCDEKAAVLVTPAGTMLAAGLIYLGCPGDTDKKKPAVDCVSAPRLKIFLKQENDRPAFVQALQDWAARHGQTGAAEKQILAP